MLSIVTVVQNRADAMRARMEHAQLLIREEGAVNDSDLEEIEGRF